MAASVNFDRASEYYDETRGFPPGVGEKVGAFIAQTGQLTKNDVVLEIGIGTGRIALPLAPYVHSITGVDISAQMMNRLRHKQTYEVIYLTLGDAMKLPLADASVDVIVITHVLHLVADVQATLKELARVLKPGGKMLHSRNGNPDRGQIELLQSAAFQGERDNGQRHRHVDETILAMGWQQPQKEAAMEFTSQTTPRIFLERIENRVWSSSWRATDEEIAGMASRVRAAIDAHFGGDAGTPIEVQSAFYVAVYTPPAS